VDERALYQSGSRIKAKVLSTPDGAKSFAYWYDTQLDVPCWFTADPDGVTRCLPTSFIGTLDLSGSGSNLNWIGWYADAACENPLLPFMSKNSPNGCPGTNKLPRWAKTCDATACGKGSCRLFEVTGLFSGTRYYVMSDKEQCVEYPQPMTWPYDSAGSVGKEVPFSIFQEAAEGLE
jgi:hypothetical protein